MSILDETGWSVTDGQPEFLYDNQRDLELTDQALVDFMMGPVPPAPNGEQWEPDANGMVYLHFPVRISDYSNYDPEAEEIQGFRYEDVDTVVKLMGAIWTYFTTPLSLDQLRNAFGYSSGEYDEIITEESRKRTRRLVPEGSQATVANIVYGHQLEGLEVLPERGHYRVHVGE